MSGYPDSGHHRRDYSEDVDSTATTLQASASSSKAHSFDDGRKYADIELERWDEENSRRSVKGHEEDDDDREDAPETEGLLARDTAILNTPAAAETARAVDDDEPPAAPPLDEASKPVSWSSLPKKTQLAILTLSRLSEPLTQTSLQAYMFYQLKSFRDSGDTPPSDSTVAQQAGILAAAFTGAQMLTAVMWGRLADNERMGRKRVILVGLLGTAIGSLGFGFSGSFKVAVFWRCVGGMLNGNMGVMRTMISEIVREKRFQSRAFLLLPMTFNIGVIVGPLLGGLLADPVGSYPTLFGEAYGGWLKRWPYALPNFVMACFLMCSAMGVIFGLEETLEGLRDKPDYGLRFSRWILRTVFRRKTKQEYAALSSTVDINESDIELSGAFQERKIIRKKLPFRRIWTPNILLTLLAHGLLAMHVGTFNNLWFVFLSTPRYTPGAANGDGDSKTIHLPPNYKPHAPFTFTGGLALPPPSIGTALAVMGVIGISLQLLLYPRVSFKMGTLVSYRYSLLLFPISYTLSPYLATIPSSLPAPQQATGALVWIGITFVLLIQVLARTFALPATAILVNNASPHPSVLGTVHGIAQTVSSATRTVGPAVVGWVYGVGLEKGIVGLAWWVMGAVAIVGAFAARWVKEGDGHEIWLEGEREEEEQCQGKG
ncbi:hypothetical protein LTR97_004667 [Elasticomyces elasticus]|uniref:Major facilitator superfamily (MFS) profile domain-containing protein n=1 Tax=Elasticomyces elasticus TaxID=574655 RepID=A0AAN8A3J2_9PEZI|nr:hypothetical protein LTR97_004667 [Elasticomyces elasticus]